VLILSDSGSWARMLTDTSRDCFSREELMSQQTEPGNFVPMQPGAPGRRARAPQRRRRGRGPGPAAVIRSGRRRQA